MSRTWKDVRPEMRGTAKRFTDRRAGPRGTRDPQRGDDLGVELRVSRKRRAARVSMERAA